VFIDIIGRALTPLSVAGMHRRTRRRSLAVGMAVGASACAASTAQASQAANSAAPSVEQQLAQLKDMRDKGLITQ
jgi:putative effector of murein hydrolase